MVNKLPKNLKRALKDKLFDRQRILWSPVLELSKKLHYLNQLDDPPPDLNEKTFEIRKEMGKILTDPDFEKEENLISQALKKLEKGESQKAEEVIASPLPRFCSEPAIIKPA